MPPPATRPRKSKDKESKPPKSSHRSKSKPEDAGAAQAAAAAAAMEFPKSEGDGYHDTADPKLIKQVLDSPAETDGHINVAVRVS